MQNGGFDISKYINDDMVRKASEIQGMVKGVMAVVICVFALISPLLPRMRESGVEILITVSYGFTILMILIGVIGLFMFARNLLAFILQVTGKEETGFGQRYMMFMVAVEACTGNIFVIVFGILFIVFSVFAFIEGPNNLAEGSTVEGLYIVSGVFLAAGLGVVIHGVVSTVKTIKSVINMRNEGRF